MRAKTILAALGGILFTACATSDTSNQDTGPVQPQDARVEEVRECEVDADCIGKLPLEPCQQSTCSALSYTCVIGYVDPDTPCNDGDKCTVGERCDGSHCVGGIPRNCDDDNPCTTDSCDEGKCSHQANEMVCDDGDPCTGPDACTEGKCDGTPIPFCFGGECCAPNGSPGCGDAAIAECVCGADAACCETMWSAECVALVTSEACGTCEVGPTCGDGSCEEGETCDDCPDDCGPCVTCGDGTCEGQETCETCPDDCGACVEPVCGDATCEASETCEACPQDCGVCPSVCGDGTCDLDEDCKSCAADCGACPDGCGDGICTIAETCESCALDCGVCVGNCCDKGNGPGCDAPLVSECVCAADPYCCDDIWDGVCVAQVETLGCAACDVVKCGDGICQPDVEECSTCEADCGKCPVCGDGNCDANESCDSCEADCGECANLCCAPNPGPGCGNAAIEACVCAFDSYCCNINWDSLCASEVEQYGCASCP